MLQTITPFAVAIIIGYLLGCFNLAFIISKVKKIDLQNTGSKNLGASNTFITVGKGLGVLVGACDIFKCTLVVILVRVLFPEMDYLPYIAGVACVLGHMFPFYLKFKGGKGIASTGGVAIAVCPLTVPLCLGTFIVCVKKTRYVSLGSILMALLFIIQVFVFNGYGILELYGTDAMEFNILAFILGAMAIIRHKDNIIRLAKGTENKIGKKPEITTDNQDSKEV